LLPDRLDYDKYTEPDTCRQWAEANWHIEDTKEWYLVRDKLQAYWDQTYDAPPNSLKGHEYVTIADDCPPKVI
jgi:hypothetical protein